jgi:hypothetical protein
MHTTGLPIQPPISWAPLHYRTKGWGRAFSDHHLVATLRGYAATVGFFERLDEKNNRWAQKKIARERKRKPDTSYPIVSTSHGLFAVTVEDLDARGGDLLGSAIPLEPVVLAIIAAAVALVKIVKHQQGKTNPPRLHYEAKVTSMSYGSEVICAHTFSTIEEASGMRTRYEAALRKNLNPRTEPLDQYEANHHAHDS